MTPREAFDLLYEDKGPLCTDRQKDFFESLVEKQEEIEKKVDDFISNTPTLLTRSQAGEYIGIAGQTLAVWALTGKHSLPFIKSGRKVLYRKSDLDKFLESRIVNNTGETVQ